MSFPSSLLSPERGGIVCFVGSGGKTSLMFALAAYLAGKGKRILTTTTTKIRPPNQEQSPLCNCSKEPLRWLRNCTGAVLPAHITLAAGYESDRNKLLGYAPETIDRLGESGFFHWILVEADGAAGRPLKAPGSAEPVLCAGSDHVIAVVGLDGLQGRLEGSNVFRSEKYAELSGIRQGDAVTPEGACRVVADRQGLFRGAPKGAIRSIILNKAETAARRQAGSTMAGLLTNRGYRVFLGSLQQGWLEDQKSI